MAVPTSYDLRMVLALATEEMWQEAERQALQGLSKADALLVMAQRPGATRLHTFTEWEKRGRRVKHGEHSIRLLDHRGCLVHVFDVSQTEIKK